MAEGKGIEPLSVRIARGSSPLCHLDATFYILAESSVIETQAIKLSLFSKQAYHLDSLLSFMFCIIHNYLKKKTTRRWSSNVVAYVLIGNVRIVAWNRISRPTLRNVPCRAWIQPTSLFYRPVLRLVNLINIIIHIHILSYIQSCVWPILVRL